MQPLTMAEFKTQAKNAQRVAVFEEIPAGGLTPITVYKQLHKIYETTGVMLENLHQGDDVRYSFVCFAPIATLTINDSTDPLTALRKLQACYAFSTRDEVAPLITSAMGFIAYDAVRYFEDIPNRHGADPALPLVFFNFYALSLTFNHEQQTILISSIAEVTDNVEQTYNQTRQKIKTIIELIQHAPVEIATVVEKSLPCPVEVDISDAHFMRMVEKAKNYIIRGDAFQIVLSRCFKRHYSVPPLEIYATLTRVSPAPFMLYFPIAEHVIICASPERMIRVQDNQVTINPIAGTRKRSANTTNDSIKVDLLNDKKEMAEHMMLVDLARNDVGAVCIPGSVRVNEFLQVKHYSHVSHITSTVTGQLQKKYDPFDAFAVAFPAGTLSGAPKIRAMQIIDELETSNRGLYGGAFCRLDALANLDSCIAIRMAILKNGIATIRSGAGIVYDSDPAAEAEETYQKARSLLETIAQAHGE